LRAEAQQNNGGDTGRRQPCLPRWRNRGKPPVWLPSVHPLVMMHPGNAGFKT
jgi:hypothetical protein